MSRIRKGAGVVAGTLGVVWAVVASAQMPANPHQLEILPPHKANKFLIKQHPPEYPAIAKLNYIQGEVRVQAIVDSGGEVAEAHVVKGHPFLAVAALKAIRNWLFKPARARPGPPAFQTIVDVKFALRTRKLNLFPQKPEKDLDRQVRPPELLEKPEYSDAAEKVRMRVLVSSEGRVLDAQPLLAWSNHSRYAERIVANWSFRPARWGAMPVPWYMEVDVPIETWPTGHGAADAGGR